MITQHKYNAFISYSHRDTEFAIWLHKTLETFSIPANLVGRKSPIGEVPKQLFPVFRDREELPTATDLGLVIENALMESASLMVLCSPRSAASMWVNQEVINYQRLHGTRNIFALIIDGNFSADAPSQSNTLVPALQALLSPSAPLAATQTLTLIDARGNNAQRQQAFTHLLSKLLDQPLTEVQSSIARQRRRRTTLTLTAMLLFGSGLVAIQQYYAHKQALAEQAAIQASISAGLSGMQQHLDAGRYSEAIKHGAQLSVLYADDLTSADLAQLQAHLHNALANNRQIAMLRHHQAKIQSLRLNADNTRLLSVDEAATAALWDTANWKLIRSWTLDSANGYNGQKKAWFSRDGKQLVIYSGQIYESNVKAEVFNSNDGSASTPKLLLSNASIVYVPFWEYQPDQLFIRRFVPGPNTDEYQTWLDIYDLQLNKQHSIQLPECGDYFSLELVLPLPRVHRLLVADNTCGGFLYDDKGSKPIRTLPELKHYYSFSYRDKPESVAFNSSQILLNPENGQYNLWQLPDFTLQASFTLKKLNYFLLSSIDRSISIFGCDDDGSSGCFQPISKRISPTGQEDIAHPFTDSLGEYPGRKWQLDHNSMLVNQHQTFEQLFSFGQSSLNLSAFVSADERPAAAVADSSDWFAAASGNTVHIHSLKPKWQYSSALTFRPFDVIRSPSGKVVLLTDREDDVSYISNQRFSNAPQIVDAKLWQSNSELWSANEHWLIVSGRLANSSDGQLLLHIPTGKIMAEFEKDSLLQAAFTVDSAELKLLQSNGVLKTFILDDALLIHTSQQLISNPLDSSSVRAAFSSDGSHLIIRNNREGTLSLFDASKGLLLTEKTFGLGRFITPYFFDNNTSIFLSPNSPSEMKLTLVDGASLDTIELPFPSGYRLEHVVNDDLLLLENDNTVLLWSLKQQRMLFDLTPYLPSGIEYVGEFQWYSEFNSLLITPNSTAVPFLLELGTSPVIKKLQCNGKELTDNYHLAMHENLLIATFDKEPQAELCIADLNTGNVYLNTLLPSGYARLVSYFPDERQIGVLLSGGIYLEYPLKHQDKQWLRQALDAGLHYQVH